MPAEADPPLVVDPDAVLPEPVPFQRFQLICGRHGKIPQCPRPMQIEKLAACRSLEGPEAEAQVAMSNRTGIAKPAAIPEATRILALATPFPGKREQATIFPIKA
jgi:hypothetical protein